MLLIIVLFSYSSIEVQQGGGGLLRVILWSNTPYYPTMHVPPSFGTYRKGVGDQSLLPNQYHFESQSSTRQDCPEAAAKSSSYLYRSPATPNPNWQWRRQMRISPVELRDRKNSEFHNKTQQNSMQALIERSLLGVALLRLKNKSR